MALYTLLFSWFSLVALIILLTLLLYIHKRTKTSKLPPGPPQLPIIGNLHQLGELPHRIFLSLSKKYGPVMYLQLGRVPATVISSAKLAKEVMKTHDIDMCSRPAQIAQRKLSYNFLDVAFAPYGSYWREMRKYCINDLLSPKKVQGSSLLREEEVAKMVQSISKLSASSCPVNLSEMLISLTNDIICRAAFGKSYLGEDELERKSFKRVFDEAGELLGGYFFEDVLPWMWWVDLIKGLHGKLEMTFRSLDAFYERVIEEHVNPRGTRPEEEDFVDVLLRVQKDLNLTRDHIKGILMNILVGGTDTGAAAVEWAMAELTRNPRTMKKVQEEVRKTMEKKEMVKESDLEQFQYLKAVVKETMRLHPPGALLIPRETIKKCEIGGYEIRPKTRLFVNAFAIGRDPESWENPEEFLPERFMDSCIDYKGQDFELIPFGAGRRSCPGMYFAAATTELVLANLVYLFNWELPIGVKNEDLDMEDSFGLVVRKKVPLQLVPVMAQ